MDEGTEASEKPQLLIRSAKDGKCPSCGGECELREKQFYWRGTFLSGYVCVPCNALWENADDSFTEHVQKTQDE